jgi:urease accessory protein UreH
VPVRASLTARFLPSARGVTAHICTEGPLELRGPFDGALPRYLLRNVTAGMLDGDCYEVRLTVEPRVRVRLEPTSAAKAFVSRGCGASLYTRLEVLPGAVLDFAAGLTIPHAGAVLHQSTDIVLHEGARVAFSESLSFGRLAQGERFAFQRVESSLRVLSIDGCVRFERRSDLVPARDRTALEAAVGAHGAVGSLLLLGGGAEAPLDISSAPGVYAGASSLPDDIGWIVHALGEWPEQMSQPFDAARAQWFAETASALAGT